MSGKELSSCNGWRKGRSSLSLFSLDDSPAIFSRRSLHTWGAFYIVRRVQKRCG